MAAKLTGKRPIIVTWFDAQRSLGNYRSRLVAKEIMTYRDDDLYAATPPIESSKYLSARLAVFASKRQSRRGQQPREDDRVVLHSDVHRAYCYAMGREVFIELPKGYHE